MEGDFSIITLPCRSSIFTLERTKGSVPIAHSKMCRNRMFPRGVIRIITNEKFEDTLIHHIHAVEFWKHISNLPILSLEASGSRPSYKHKFRCYDKNLNMIGQCHTYNRMMGHCEHPMFFE